MTAPRAFSCGVDMSSSSLTLANSGGPSARRRAWPSAKVRRTSFPGSGRRNSSDG